MLDVGYRMLDVGCWSPEKGIATPEQDRVIALAPLLSWSTTSRAPTCSVLDTQSVNLES
jgi:hypothetical protein